MAGVALAIVVATILLCLVVGVPIAVSLGAAGIIGVLVVGGTDQLGGITFAMWNSVDNATFTSVPLFLLMGQIIMRSGISGSFYRALNVWFGWIPGGLLQTNIVAAGLFAAISGNSVATAATVSEVAAPELKRRGYRTDRALGSIAGGGTLGILIPPSIPLILYAALVSESVVTLFAAALVPGLALLVLFMLYVFISEMRRSSGGERVHATAADRLAQVRHILPVVVLIAAVLGGIYSGVTTVTEASALGALGALVLALIYRGLTWRSLFEALKRTVWVTAMIMAIVIGANILSFGLATTGAARALTAWVTASAPSVGVFLLLVFVLLFVLGMFMEGLSMMMLTMPILFPLLQAYDVNMVWFGVVLVVLIEVGLITPPVGMNLFVLQGVTGEKISTIARGAVPYLIIMLAFVGLLWAFPSIAMWLPGVMAASP